MNKPFSIAAAILTIAGSTAAFAAELPSYEVSGLPVSPVQLSVLGAAHVRQQETAPATSATVHQVSVLTPRKIKIKTARATTGAAR
jgi:hypothetical protein